MRTPSLMLPTRRTILAGSAALLAAPALLTRPAFAAQQLMVRTPGGAFDEVKRKTVYEPFRQATGIEIVPVPSTMGKMLAMFKAGQVDLDCIDTGNDALVQLDEAGALAPIDYKAFKYTDPADLEHGVALPHAGRLVRLRLRHVLQHGRVPDREAAEILGGVLGSEGVPRAPHAGRHGFRRTEPRIRADC